MLTPIWRCVLVLVMLALFGRPAFAQHLAHGASGLAHGIPDFCATATDRILVPAGEARTLSGQVETSCLGVFGTLTVASNTTLRVDTLLIYPAGTIIIGTADQPATGVEIIIRNRPLDLAADPEQFGQGVIGFGTVRWFGTPTAGAASRSITIRSESATGVRGHVLFTQRADLDIRYVGFVDLGRTKASEPLNSTTFTSDAVNQVGTNQIGRYSLHLHHVMGPLPAKSRQFTLVGNLFLRGEKWGGITLHNSHFGLMQDNHCTQAAAICYVEEDGSETDNHWIGNYAGQITNPSISCDLGGGILRNYDPEGRCGSGFWLRGVNQVLRNNVIEDVQSTGIGWWTLCLEASGPPCGGNVPVTIPLFHGADTTDPAQRQTCGGFPCSVWDRVGLEASGNVIRRAAVGLEMWWTPRVGNGGAPITNTTMEDVALPIAQMYSDAVYDGVIARWTKPGTPAPLAVGFFNDGEPLGRGTYRSELRRADLRGYDVCWSKIGQLDQPPLFTIADSFCQSNKGLQVIWGGQGNGNTQDFRVERFRYAALDPTKPAIAFTLWNWPEAVAGQRINTTVIALNGNAADNFSITSPNEASPCQTTRPEVVGAFACPMGAVPPTPQPDPPPAPQPVDPCIADPLRVSGVRWPGGNTGSRSLTFSTGAKAWTSFVFTWPGTLIVRDARGCAVTVRR